MEPALPAPITHISPQQVRAATASRANLSPSTSSSACMIWKPIQRKQSTSPSSSRRSSADSNNSPNPAAKTSAIQQPNTTAETSANQATGSTLLLFILLLLLLLLNPQTLLRPERGQPCPLCAAQ